MKPGYQGHRTHCPGTPYTLPRALQPSTASYRALQPCTPGPYSHVPRNQAYRVPGGLRYRSQEAVQEAVQVSGGCTGGNIGPRRLYRVPRRLYRDLLGTTW